MLPFNIMRLVDVGVFLILYRVSEHDRTVVTDKAILLGLGVRLLKIEFLIDAFDDDLCFEV